MSNTARVTWVLCALFSVYPVALGGYNVERNLREGRRIAKACGELGNTPMMPLAAVNVIAACAFAVDEVQWWRWNGRRQATFKVPVTLAHATQELGTTLPRYDAKDLEAVFDVPARLDVWAWPSRVLVMIAGARRLTEASTQR